VKGTLLWALPLLVTACGTPSPEPVAPPGPAPSASTTAVAVAAPKPGPKLARREDVVDVIHGVKVADPYRWLEDGKSDDTKAFLTRHGEFTRKALDQVPGYGALVKRLEELSYIEYVRPPRRRAQRLFFERRHKDKEKAVWYWRASEGAEPKVLIDPNTLSDDGSVSLKGIWPSWDGRRVAYKLSENNADESTMYVMDVASGKKSTVDIIPGAKYASASWNRNGTGFYYTRLPVDDAIPVSDRPGFAQIVFHKLGGNPKKDRVVVDKTGDPKVFLSPELSRDGNYLFLYKFHGWTRNDLQFKDLRRHKEWQTLGQGEDAKFYAYAWKDKIYVQTNLDAPRYRMFRVDPKKPARADWEEIVPQDDEAVLESFGVIGGRLALTYLKNASSRVVLLDLDGKKVRDIDLPGIGTVIGPVGNPDHDTAYYGFSSYTTPSTVFETSIAKAGKKPYFALEVPVDTAPFMVEQVWFRSKDRTRVSMFVIRRRDMKMDGSTPLLLSGYGGFNINMTPRFYAKYFAFLERGGAIAIPNLRGGGEYGEQWHKDGMRDKKQNVFDDFIAAAEFLIAQGYTSSKRLAVRGASNGGLLVGAVMTQRPELYQAVICGVPLLDMVRYHQFGSGKTWISEYGSADDPKLFGVLHAYSPYHHVKQGTDYPSMLMLSADSDDRVDPMHARKFVAAVRQASSGTRPTLLRVETNAGHGGGDMIKKDVARWADTFAFLFQELGM
jgi:prolyl oligopeptidase